MQSILDFFEGLPEHRWLLAGVLVAGSFVAAWLADQVILRVLLRWARRTAWKIDDDLLAILHHPVTRSVVLVGLGLAAGRLQLTGGAAVATARVLWTLGILLWTVFAFRLCRILLLSASGQAERYRLIETRTFPLFDNLAKVLIVGVDDSGSSVYSIDSAGGSIPDVYCATGSGSPYMYGVLEDQFSDGMSQDEALRVAAKALLASAQRDAASGNGMDLAVITADVGFNQLSEDEVSNLLSGI